MPSELTELAALIGRLDLAGCTIEEAITNAERELKLLRTVEED